jgi:hypothetical protein
MAQVVIGTTMTTGQPDASGLWNVLLQPELGQKGLTQGA